MVTCAYGSQVNITAKNIITFGDLAALVGVKALNPWVWVFLSIVQYEAHGMLDECGTVPTINDFPSEQDFCDIGANFGGVMSGTCIAADPGRAVARFKEWLISLAWPYFCECTPGAVATCPTDSWTTTATLSSNTIATIDTNWIEVPEGANQTKFTVNTFVQSGGTWSLQYLWFDRNRTQLSSGTSMGATASVLPFTNGFFNRWPTGDPKWLAFRFTRGTGTGTFTVTATGTVTWNGSCQLRGTLYVPPAPGAVPTSVTVPVEPTTCTTTEVCQRVADLQITVQRIASMLTLVQRQSVPFAYVPGATHTGLSGNGSIAVQGIHGLSVDITASPSYLGSVSGTPTTKFDYGWVSVGTADGWERSTRLTHDGHLILGISGAATLVGYTFPSGVTASIKELVREPA